MKANPTWKRRIGRLLLALFGVFVLFSAVAVVAGWRAFGHRAEGARRERIERSSQWHGDHFDNPEPLVNDTLRDELAFPRAGAQR